MYKYKDKARYSLVNNKGYIPPHQILNYFQNCSSEQSEVIGKGVKYMMSQKKAWVLLGYKLVIQRPIKYEEELIVGTEPTGFKGFFGRRNYCIMDTEENFSGYTLGQSFENVKAARKLRFKSEGELKGEFEVLKNYIDNNGHMNNANYLMLADEFLPSIENIAEIDIAFIKEAMLGQKMEAYVHDEEEGIGVSFMVDGEEACKILARTR